MKPIFTLVFAIAVTVTATSSSRSGTTDLAYWSFNSAGSFTSTGTSNIYTATPDTSAPGVTVGNITPVIYFSTTGYGINNVGGLARVARPADTSTPNKSLRVTSSSYTNGGAGYSEYNVYSLTSALARQNYFEFTITAAAGYSVTLDSISFTAYADPATDGKDAERGFWLLSSIDGYSSDKALLSAYSKPNDAGSTLDASFKPFSTNAFAGTTLASGESVSFRFYVQTPSNASYVFFDDLRVVGSVTQSQNIPEPSDIAAFLGCCVLAATYLRRRI